MKKQSMLALGLMGIIGLLSLGMVKASTYNIETQNPGWTYGTITIYDPADPSVGFTIMDRNLGATTNDITSEDSYGYKYQWGNNYGFADSETITSVTDGLEWDENYNNSGYYSTDFINGYSHDYDVWSGNRHYDGLWGGSGDYDNGWDNGNQKSYRQGPCPSGYHVPSQKEWNDLLLLYGSLYTGAITNSGTDEYGTYYEGDTFGEDFANYFKLPFAGGRDYYDASLYVQGSFGFYWSSSPFGSDYPYSARYLLLNSSYVGAHNRSYRAYGFPVRCFKDSYMDPTYTISFLDDGVELASGTVTEGNTRSETVPTPADREGYEFDYRYADGTNSEFNFTTPITADTILHAKWNLTVDINDGIYTGLNGGDITVVWKDPTRGDVNLTVAGESLPGTYQWGTMSPGEVYSTDDNAWGGVDDYGYDSGNERYKRQGPCGEGYHVPSAGERENLVVAWCNLDSECAFDKDSYMDLGFLYDEDEIGFGTKFKETFNIADSEYYFWSSSPYPTAEHDKAYVADIEEESIIPAEDDNRYYDGVRVRCFKNYLNIPPTTYTLTFDSQGGDEVATGVAVESGTRTRPENPTKSGYIFVDWYTSTGYEDVFDFTGTLATGNLTIYAKWGCEIGYKDNGTACVATKDIVLEATATEADQTLTINKYFNNAFTVDRGDGSPVVSVTTGTTHTYSSPGDYTIILSLTGTATRWTFRSIYSYSLKPLIPRNGTTMTGIKITYMPSLAVGFGSNATAPGNYLFSYFNYNGAIISLPEGSFDTSNITKAGDDFFYCFNNNGSITNLPERSFDISNITTVGEYFFFSFNEYGKITSLPEGSFKINNITGSVKDDFFCNFNREGAITSLPEGSFDTSNITIVGSSFFGNFNDGGKITSLPEGSFKTDKIVSVGNYFFNAFNSRGQIVSLPEGSFKTENIASVGNYFFNAFNSYGGKITSLPEGSFKTENIASVGNNFFSNFNYSGALTSLPEGSFRLSTGLVTVGNYFFTFFNDNGQIMSLPEGSFKISSGLAIVGDYFFNGFNLNGQITSLPAGSFNTSNITTVGKAFFTSFNYGGALTSLPIGSFNTSNITMVGNNFFGYFNNSGALTSLPTGSFNTSNITTAGYDFFGYFNNSGALTSLPEGSFDISNITTEGGWFFEYFNNNGAITSLPNSFTMNSIGVSGTDGYLYAFNSTGYTINKKVSELVLGLTIPSSDRDTFSDNQPGRCGVHENWLVSTADACSISYDDGLGGTGTYKYTADTTGVVVGSGITVPTITGYSLSGWYDASGNKVEEVIFPDMDGKTLNAYRIPNQYTLTIDVDGTLTVITGDYGSPVIPPSDPTKDGYKFVGREPEIPATMPAEDMTIKAKWERNGSSGGGGGGGGGSSSSSSSGSTSTGSDTSQPTGSGANNSTGTQNDQTITGTNIKEPEGTGKEIPPVSPLDEGGLEQPEGQDDASLIKGGAEGNEAEGFSTEFQQAYEFAKGKGITTMPTIQKAQMYGNLTRIAMAKMLSQYAINVLGKTPDTSKNNKFNDVSDKRDSDYNNGVTLAYQLGIMGQNMPNNKFRPDDEVTRAEFATALSRMIYGTSDGIYKSTSEYYVNHMKKLKEEGIITKDDPKMKELRGYVMIMLMRSAK